MRCPVTVHPAFVAPNERPLDADVSQPAIVKFLSDPATYGQQEPVEIHATHGSLVFLSRTHAYKMKRAVWYPYMDYSTASRRKAMCELELYVNKRMAPQLYEGVLGVIPSAAGLRFGDADDRSAVEWVVAMKRFREGDLLENRRKADNLHLSDMAAVGREVAAFHATAEVVDRFGGISGLRAVVEENMEMLRNAVEISAGLKEQYAALSEEWLRRMRATLGWRRHTGLVRRCHGDLHLNNICLVGGKPLLFDAIEFDDSFACIDTGFDLAFLLMDLDTHGLRHHANVVLNHYLERTRDYGLLNALPLFLATRAALRAHIAIAKHKMRADDDLQSPQALLQRALGYMSPAPPKLMAVGGVSGSGKSTIAALIAPMFEPAPGAIVLRSDVIRKAMFGVSETTRLPDRAYDEAATAAVYWELRRLAMVSLRAGHSVIVDAVFGTERQREGIAASALQSGAEFEGIWLNAPRTLLEKRLAARAGDASDADAGVLAKQLATISPPKDWLGVDNGQLTSSAVETIKKRIHPDRPANPISAWFDPSQLGTCASP